MSFGQSKGFRTDKPFEDYKKFVNTVLTDDYSIVCIKKCFKNFDLPLDKNEKICLAKCSDRSYDYLMEIEGDLNPYQKTSFDKFFNTNSPILESQSKK